MKVLVFTIFIAIFLSACTDFGFDCETYDYSDCLLDEPTTWNLNISLTINSENPEVKICVFKGDFENGDTLATQICNQTDVSFELPVNQNYSVTADYKSGVRRILAVDGDEMRTKSHVVCEKKCWKVKGNSLDVRIN